MKVISYSVLEKGMLLTTDEPVTIVKFADYAATVYGRATGNLGLTTEDVTSQFKESVGDQLEFGIGRVPLMPDLIVTGNTTASDTYSIRIHNLNDREKFQKFTKALDDICNQ